jgi:transcriptional regulator with XRE-family HTH domain
MDSKALGKRISEARQAQGITSDKLSEACHVNPTHIRHIECGGRTPSLPLFVTICNSLRISSDHLLQDSLEENDRDERIHLSERLQQLNPKQLSAVNDMIDTLLSHLD